MVGLLRLGALEEQYAGRWDSFSEYAREHPTGTGPFRFVSYDEGNGTKQTMTRTLLPRAVELLCRKIQAERERRT